MARKFLRKFVPDAEAVRGRRLVAFFAPWLGHPRLWSLNHHSVPGAVAIGLFCGLIPGPFQMLGALLVAVPLRQNVPVALVVTFYTNPFTIVPLYLLAYRYGLALLPDGRRASLPAPYEVDWSDWIGSLHALLDWMLSLGKPLAVGLVALAVTLAVAGYFATSIAWRLHVVYSWRRRKRRGTG
ncbi:MAG: DUF2062 domain-containing protein [Clostridia bacterium]